MLNAASDSTPYDRRLAAATYVVARRGGFGEAADLIGGRLKVDAVPAGYLPDPAEGMYTPRGRTAKGDTIYLLLGLDPSTLKGQATIVHELTHAADDKASIASTTYLRARAELAAHRREGRFLLESIMKLGGEARRREIETLGNAVGDHLLRCLVLEADARPGARRGRRVQRPRARDQRGRVPARRRGARARARPQHARGERGGGLPAIERVYRPSRGERGRSDGLRGESSLDE